MLPRSQFDESFEKGKGWVLKQLAKRKVVMTFEGVLRVTGCSKTQLPVVLSELEAEGRIFRNHMPDGIDIYGVPDYTRLDPRRFGAVPDTPKRNKYQREIKPGVWVDVYDVLAAFAVTCPALAHAVKKCLAPGQRGAKDSVQDKREAVASIERSIEMEIRTKAK